MDYRRRWHWHRWTAWSSPKWEGVYVQWSRCVKCNAGRKRFC